ncbi:MAG: dihydrodipicolinate synthase family protein [Bryobacteraceae bacterium]
MDTPSLQIRGIVPVIPTPFDSGENIAWDELRNLIDFASAAGVSAVCLPAYASEFYKLSEDERSRLVIEAVALAQGRVPVVAQVNYFSALQAAQVAARMSAAGASGISVAVPRLFSLSERDLFRYFDRILRAIDVPLIIQDFNPGGPSLSPAFIRDLHKQHPHFRYVKLEEPMMAGKVEAILEATDAEVGVLEGWGGMYMMQLVPAGICGVMPGLGVADILSLTFRLLTEGKAEEAFDIFQGVLPQIAFSLQNLELYHHAEKKLLQARGILASGIVRDAGMDLRASERDHIDFLNSRVLALLDRLHMRRNPARP